MKKGDAWNPNSCFLEVCSVKKKHVEYISVHFVMKKERNDCSSGRGSWSTASQYGREPILLYKEIP